MGLNRIFETAATLVYDPVSPNRNATRASLYSIGFRRVELVPTLDMLRERISLRTPDLLMMEVSGSEEDVCTAVQGIRQGTLGNNPFIVIIVTTWRRDGTIINQVLNSGADDLIARPVSATMLGERIKGLIERRKRFVVTMDYIGPDRRRESRARSAECFEVPNPLKTRGLDGLTEEDVEQQIAVEAHEGRKMLDKQKVRRDSVQLCLQTRWLAQKTPGTREFRDILPRIETLVGDMTRRLDASGDKAALECCEAIAKAATTLAGLIRGGRSDSADYQPTVNLLGQSAMTLGRMFAPEDVAPERLLELDRLIASRAASSAAA